MLLEYKGWIKPVLGAARVCRQGRVLATSAHPAPDPHRTLARDLLAVSLHPWRCFCHPLALCHLGLPAGSAALRGLAPRAGSEPVSGGLLSCPACRAHLPLSRALPFPSRARPASHRSLPCLWRAPFPSRRQAPAACARLKMETLASYCSSA